MKVLIASDFCPNHRVNKSIENNSVIEVFNDYMMLLKEVDYSIVNLECPINNGMLKGIEKIGPVLSTTSNAAKILKAVGFDAVSLANNHIKDFGEQGVLDTVSVCKKASLAVVGAGKNVAEASKVLYFKKDGINIGVYNVTENEFSVADELRAGANPHNQISDFYNITQAVTNCDYLIVLYHGGHEGYSLPSPRMKKLFRFYVDCGASSVICHHAHRHSGYEVYKDSPIFYGLGNFCFDWPNITNTKWNIGYSVVLEFKTDFKINFRIYPYEQGTLSNHGVVLLKDERLIGFFEELNELNALIQDDIKLKDEFGKYVITKNKFYLGNLEPYNNKYLKALFSRGLLPSFFRKKKSIVTNIIRCESHRDVLLELLEKNN